MEAGDDNLQGPFLQINSPNDNDPRIESDI